MPLQGYNGDGGSLVVAWNLEATAEDAWEHFTNTEMLSEWLGVVRSGSFRSGETLVVGHGDGKDSTSTIGLMEPGRRLMMSWDFPEEPSSEVGVLFSPGQGGSGCRLDLHHVGLGDLVSSYLPGWMTHLAFFEASLAGSPLPVGSFWQVYGTFERLTS